MSKLTDMYEQYPGYRRQEFHLENWFNPILFWYKVDEGDKAMNDFPIVEDCFATSLIGEFVTDIVKLEEWDWMKAKVLSFNAL